MAETLLAVGLAANVLQFLDVGTRFANNLWSMATTGKDTEYVDVRKVSEDLQAVLKRLESSTDARNEAEQSLALLVRDCKGVAKDLLEMLQTVKLPSKARRRDAIKPALMAVWKRGKIESLQASLDGFRQQLILHLLTIIREQGQQSVTQQQQLLQTLNAVHKDTSAIRREGPANDLNVVGFGNALLTHLMAGVQPRERDLRDQKLVSDLLVALEGQSEVDDNIENPTLPLPTSRQKMLHSTFLKLLDHRAHMDREGRIVAAHEKTFQWIFQSDAMRTKSWASFSDWLESDSQLYWITGKPGSGKSTLMKYICEKREETGQTSDPNESLQPRMRCEGYLKRWAADQEFIVATFYFWSLGEELQVSRKGLMVSLLFQILESVPEVIPNIAPRRWEALCLFNGKQAPLGDDELRQMLRSAVEEVSKSMKLCLFIDGLDEFSGDHSELLALLKDLIANQNVKVCVSSRPWIVFEDAFKHKPSLMLQDLTYFDIKSYVSSNLHADTAFAQLQQREQDYADRLIHNIVSKASGVFLWVNLVVKSLLAGMAQGDRVSDLQKRLDLLPSDLENLFERILQSLDPFYLQHAAQLFELLKDSKRPLSLLVLSFADEEEPRAALSMPIEPLTARKMEVRLDAMRRRVNSRCKGLVEVTPQFDSYVEDAGMFFVQYLHKTVRDYFESSAAQEKLSDALGSSFDPYYRLCMGELACLKTRPLESSKETFWARVGDCFDDASHMQAANRGAIVPLVQEVERTRVTLTLRYRNIAVRDQMRNAARRPAHLILPDLPLRIDAQDISLVNLGARVIRMAVSAGLIEYVASIGKDVILVQKKGVQPWPLLVDAVLRSDFHETHPVVAPRPDIFACLLKKGSDPNHSLRDYDDMPAETIWYCVCRSMVRGYNGKTLESPWPEIAELMIKHGAIVNRKTLYALTNMTRFNGDGKIAAAPTPWDKKPDPKWISHAHSDQAQSLYNELVAIKKRVGPSTFSRVIKTGRLR